ncbi:MAG: metalloregulator ArsR/SmtB family transcription factor [Deltaproteobacteria bacterium]|nr:metalloregulator ArsR/SmtB family transcription factor [Deltaproteobacteria bacterium]MCL5792757.1 metalloregulator ArsR/SmtB family transcription factor [Deltaproteobacteria bacterium]
MLKDFIKTSKALSDETRVRIVSLLMRNELCVCQLMEILGMGQSTVSKHLGILRNAGLIEVEKRGTWSFYGLCRDKANRHNLDFIRILSSLPTDDPFIQNDEKKLKKVNKKGLTFCNTIELGRRIRERSNHAE